VKQKIAGIVRDRTFSEIPSVARDRYSWNRRQGLYVWSNRTLYKFRAPQFWNR